MLLVFPMCSISACVFACFRFFILEFYLVVFVKLLLFCVNFFHFLPIIAFFHVHRFFCNYFPLFLLSQIVKLKTKIKPFCFRARKILSFVEMFGCVSLCVYFFSVCWCEKFDFTAFGDELC